MTLHELPLMLERMVERFPVIRGYKTAQMFVDIDPSGDGNIQAWFSPKKTNDMKEFVALIMKNIPSKAWWRYGTIDRLIAALEGRITPEWMFDDELETKLPKE